MPRPNLLQMPTDGALAGGGYYPQTTGSIINNGGLNPILPGQILPGAVGTAGGSINTPLGLSFQEVGEFNNETEDETSISPPIAFTDDELFDGLRFSKPLTPTVRDTISEFGGRRKGTKAGQFIRSKAGGFVTGALFGVPGLIFRKRAKKRRNRFDGGELIEDDLYDYYDEFYADELTDHEFESFMDHESEVEGFLGIGKKAKARKVKRIERRDARKSARVAKKQARVDRKNKRVEIRQYKAETKRIKTENNEPSALDKILDAGKSILTPKDDSVNQDQQPDENFQDDQGGGYSENSNSGLGNVKNFSPQTKQNNMLGSNPTMAIIIGLALLGAVIYFIKQGGHGK